MEKMTIAEAADYIAAMDFNGVTLTPIGVGAARIILETRKAWTPSHFLMLNRLDNGAVRYPRLKPVGLQVGCPTHDWFSD